MSYDISLCDPVTGDVLELETAHHMRGGTYAVGGTTDASLNVTYNYAVHYRRLFQGRTVTDPDVAKRNGCDVGHTLNGIRSIYGLTGAESIPVLQAVIAKLGDDVADDYWEATEGNAKRALSQLLALAHMRPDGVWSGD